MDGAAPKKVARKAESNTALQTLARAGYAANGVVHMLIGVIIIVIAGGGDAEGDQSGAFMAIAAAPAGFIALWILAIALCALGVWHGLEGVLARDRVAGKSTSPAPTAQRWLRRIAEWGQALVFIALGVIAASVALGARVSGEESAENASRGALALPGGSLVLGLVGVGLVSGGGAFVVRGVRRSFESRVTIPSGAFGAAVTALGIVGFVAKGIALTAIGVLLIVAAARVDPHAAGGLDGAIAALRSLTFGPVLVAGIGVGFIAYGVFCMFRARYAALQAS